MRQRIDGFGVCSCCGEWTLSREVFHNVFRRRRHRQKPHNDEPFAQITAIADCLTLKTRRSRKRLVGTPPTRVTIESGQTMEVADQP